MDDNTLFDIGSPRDFHESESQQQEALKILRLRPLTKLGFERDWPGSRLAPAIDILRNGWGFEIDGQGIRTDPYRLLNRFQSPTKVRCSQAIRDAYYKTEHWECVRDERYQFDNYRCVACTGKCHDELNCHHLTYSRLFGEKLDDLITVCTTHHKLIHDESLLKFPTGVDLWIAERLLGVATYSFKDWLLP